MTEQVARTAEDIINQADNPTIIMEEWSRIDSVSASAWLSGQAPGPQRDAAIAGFVNTMIFYEPEAAAEWSQAIADPTLQKDYLQASIDNWLFTDPAAAVSWLENSGLDPTTQKSLLGKATSE